MRLKHSLPIFGLVAMLGLGVGVGLASRQQAKEAKAASMTLTFKVASSELSSWGGVGNWGIYAWHGSTAIIDTLDSCYGNMTLNDGYYTKSVTYSDTIDGVILLFKQSEQKWKSEDITAGGGFVNTHVYALSYKNWVSDDDGQGRKVFTANIEDTSVAPEFSLIGSFGGHDWNYDVDFEVEEATTTATLSSVVLAKGDTFKVRKNHAWAVSYGWTAANGHVSVTDAYSRGGGDNPSCFGDGGSDNVAVLHDGTYNFSLNYSTGVLNITGARAEYDTEVTFRIFISNDGGSSYTPTTMELKPESSTEYMLTRDFAAGELFYFRFGSYYYHYSDLKDGCALADKQFVQTGEDGEALYNANYTVYFETDAEGDFGLWLQYNSVSSAQIRSNVISYATYFNDQVGGACDIEGKTTVISDLQTAWTNVKARYDNAPADSVRTAIVSATGEDENAEVSEFVGKYDSVYYLRGSSLSSQGGDFLAKGITPKSSVGVPSIITGVDSQSNSLVIIIAASSIAVLALIGGYFYFRKRKEDR